MIKESITVKERILLHLSEFTNLENERLFPNHVTQLGMANLLNIRQGHISRAVKELEDKAMVVGRQGYVQGASGRRKVYLITYKGLVDARNIKDRLLSNEVLFRDEKGNISHVKLEDAYEEIRKHVQIRFSDFITLFVITSDEVVSIESARKFVEDNRLGRAYDEKKGVSYVDFSGSAPRPKHFHGRSEEIAQIKNWIAAGLGVNVIIGMAGIGKSAFAWRVMKEYENKKNIFWYQFHKWSTLRHMLFSLADFMDQMGINDLKSYLESREIDISEVVEILKKTLNGTDTLLVLDDFHETTDKIIDFFSALVSCVHEISKFSVVITSRKPVPIYDRRDVSVRKVVGEIYLKGLDIQSVSEIIRERHGLEKVFDDEEIRKIYDITEGHPLFLELIKMPGECVISDNMKNEMTSEVQKFIYDEIFSRLTAREGKLLEIASVFRHPFPPSAVFIDEDVDYNTLDSLVDRCLLTECPENLYDTHELIKSFFYRRLSPANRQRYHLNAAKVYLGSHIIETDLIDTDIIKTDFVDHENEIKSESQKKNIPGIDEIEAMHHYICAGHEELAIELAIKYGRELIARGYLLEFMAVINGIEDAKGRLESQIKDMKAEILSLWGRGEWDIVMEYHIQSKFLSDLLLFELNLTQIHEIISSSKRKDEDWERAIKDLENSIETLHDINDEEGKSTLRKALAWTYWMKRDIRKAKEEYAKSAECTNLILSGKAYVELGNLYWSEGDFREAEKSYLLGLGKLKLSEDKFECVRAYVHLGDVYSHMGELKSAMESYNNALDICYKSNFMQGSGYVHLHMSQALIKDERYRESAREYIDESIRIFERLRDNVGLGYAMIAKGAIIRDEDPYKALELLSSGLELIDERALDMPFYVFCTEVLIGRHIDKHAGKTMAEKHYARAKEVLNSEIPNGEFVFNLAKKV